MNQTGSGIPGSIQLALGFLALITAGTALLLLPAAAADGESLPFLDALFTSTSAVCITGLSTIDVGSALSRFGQGVLLALIQLGALGITTMSVLLLVAAGRARITHQATAQTQLAAGHVKPHQLIAWVAATLILAQATGVLLLRPQLDVPDAGWQALFHSVSAFCNAGFSLYPDSLTGLRGRPGILAVIMVLIALGGIGFIALRQLGVYLGGRLLRRPRRLMLHTRIVLVASAVLWVGGALMFLACEWNHTLAELPLAQKLYEALFQSVTTRTAGFSTLDFGAMCEGTLFLTMFLMLIGGAPGGVAGGLKVTTAVVLLASMRARLRGAESVWLFKRTLPVEVVQRAFQLVALAVVFLTFIVGVLLFTEQGLAGHEHHFLRLAFEAVSAFGTVGLSTGLTPELSAAGRLLVVLTMFVGRIGPLAFALVIVRPRPVLPIEYPREELAIG